jgi:hypothetical protein
MKIIYRISDTGYNKIKPDYINNENCLLNALDMFSTEKHDWLIIADNVSQATTQMLEKYVLNIKHVSVGHGAGTFNLALDKALTYDDNEIVYFIENDYLHTDNWVEEIVTLFQTYPQGLNYVSLYDHNDKYFLPMYDNLASKIFTTPTKHWRTTPSTCGSYIISKNIFIEDEDINTGGPGDHDKFLHLNSTKNRFVLTPIPGLSTHCMEGLLSPTINWKKINN